jgi:hypothetical protein
MKTIHAKSQCCLAKVHRFGRRRRQCSACQKTWTVRPRKRGRPAVRITSQLIQKVIQEGRSLKALAKAKRFSITEQALGYRYRQMLYRFRNTRVVRRFPSGPLTLLVDGLWFRFRGRLWTLYMGAVKSRKTGYAFFLDPLLLEGRENLQDWNKFIEAIPAPVKARIEAVVGDNFRGIKRLAKQNGWVLQLCHFHLICQLHARRGHRRRVIAQIHIRESIYQLIRQALELPDGPQLNKILCRLKTIQRLAPAKRLGMIAREFIRNISYYRAYQQYPYMGLPTTTNTIESMGRRIRDLMRRVGNLRTPKSLKLWMFAFIRLKPKMTCNGKHFQQNNFV